MSAVAAVDQWLTLSDVALLARVRRPVVSVWRNRSAGTADPFPAPRSEDGGQPLFALQDVVSWLEQTRRGNNPDPAADAVAFTLRASQVVRDERLFAGLTALLCLRAVAGELPTAGEALLDLADAADPDDLVLYREVEAVEDVLPELARYASLLGAAALHPADPVEALVRQRRSGSGRSAPRLGADLCELVASAAWAVADQADFADPTFVLTSPDDIELVLAVARQAEDRGAVPVAFRSEDDGALRLARRRLRAQGIQHVDIGDDALADLDGAVVLCSLPGSGREADERALALVSDLALTLTPRHRALVVGSSACLTDALRVVGASPGRPASDGELVSHATLLRRDTIRTGLLRGVVRLPQGALPGRVRARAALWCLGPDERRRGLVPHTWCADVTTPLTDTVREELVTDVVAAMAGVFGARGHGLQHGRFVPTSELQLSAGDLVAPRAPRSAEVTAADLVQSLTELSTAVAHPLAGVGRVDVTPVTATGAPRRQPLGEAAQRGWVRWIRGARVDPADLSPDGAVPVITSPEQVETPTQGMDRLRQAARFPDSQLTRAGDVVVTTVGGPRAAVDSRGGAFVAHPARVLRVLDGAPFTPDSVAADINAQPCTTTRWQAWSLTAVPDDQVTVLDVALQRLADHRRDLEARLRTLDELSHTLTTGISSRTCRLSPATTTTPPDEGR